MRVAHREGSPEPRGSGPPRMTTAMATAMAVRIWAGCLARKASRRPGPGRARRRSNRDFAARRPVSRCKPLQQCAQCIERDAVEPEVPVSVVDAIDGARGGGGVASRERGLDGGACVARDSNRSGASKPAISLAWRRASTSAPALVDQLSTSRSLSRCSGSSTMSHSSMSATAAPASTMETRSSGAQAPPLREALAPPDRYRSGHQFKPIRSRAPLALGAAIATRPARCSSLCTRAGCPASSFCNSSTRCPSA